MSQKSTSRTGGIFVNGLIDAEDISEYDFKKKICDAWDYTFDGTLFEAVETDISDSEVKEFASADTDEYSDIYFHTDRQLEVENTDAGYRYIQQSVDFVNTFKAVRLLKVSNKEFARKPKDIVEACFYLVKGEHNYIYYETELNKRDRNTWFLPYIFVECLTEDEHQESL